MSKPIVVELTKATAAYPKGAELGFATEAQARQALGDDTAFRIVRYQDGTEYEAPQRVKKADKA